MNLASSFQLIVKVLLCLNLMVTAQRPGVPPSPCPNYFSYFNANYGEVKGLVSIDPPRDISTIFVALDMIVLTRLHGDYVGSMDLNESLENLLHRLRSNPRERINLIVTFPSQNPLPMLTKLTMNGQVLCQSAPAKFSGPHHLYTITRRILFSGPFLPASNQPHIDNGNCPYGQNCAQQISNSVAPFYPTTQFTTLRTTQSTTTTTPSTTTTTTTTTTRATTKASPNPPTFTTNQPIKVSSFPAPTTATKSEDTDCGMINRPDNEDTRYDFWPWQVAIFQVNPKIFACGGTLVSDRHIITSGSCLLDFSSKDTEVDRKNIEVQLGKYNLNDPNEASAQKMPVERVILHESRKNSGPQMLIDLAIIVTGKSANFNGYVTPICLYGSNIPNFLKTVVYGWGDSENAHKKVNMVLSRPEQKQCKDFGLEDYFEKAIFCAKTESKFIALCKADRGGGLCSKGTGIAKKYYLRGILSQAPWQENNGACTLKPTFAIFTNIEEPSVKSWIEAKINGS